MVTLNYLLNKFLPQIDFESYEEFREKFTINVPEDFNFGYDVVDAWAGAEPDKRALVWVNEQDEERVFTFTDIKRLSNRVANLLRDLGLKKGDVAMMILRRRWEYWVCATALHKLGVILIPATLQLTKKDIVYRGNAAEVKAVICVDDDFVVSQMEASAPEIPSLKHRILVSDSGTPREGWLDLHAEMDKRPETFPRPTGDAATRWDDVMLVYFTSGTTGMPKLVQHNFAYPLGHIVTAKYWQHVEDNGRHLTQSDSGWAKFAWGKIYGQWIAGTELVAYDQLTKFDGKKMLEAIDHLKLTTFCAPPTIYRFIINEDMSGIDFSSLHHCCTAGEPLYPDIVNKFREATGHTIYEGFGQTETTVVLANYGWDEVKCGSTGKPSPIYDIDIVDDDGNPCEDGIVGHIVVKNAESERPTGLFTEYIGDEEAMKRAWYKGWYDTGDMAWRDSDGYFWFEGRSDDVIKCSGYRIGPFEVESALATHPAVLESAVTAAPDPIRGQVVKATIVLKAGYEGSDALIKELQNHVKKATAPYKYPRIIEFVKELPKTISNKTKRAEIRKRDAQSADNK